jgi:hypothetical protein
MAGKQRVRRLTRGQRVQSEQLFRDAVSLQEAFWDALFDLEQALHINIDETRDLSDWSLDALRKGCEDDVGRVSWFDPTVGPERREGRDAGVN